MYTITDNSVYEYEIKKSKFITVLYKVNNILEIDNYLKEIRNIYQNATHYCYGYIIDDVYHFSDDGEPGGTAGLPIIEILKKKNINYVLCIVVRYFGGIKLGAGGLVRAYSKSVRDALDSIDLVELIDGYQIELNISYDNSKKFEYLVKKYKIVEKEFNEFAKYVLEIPKNNLELFNTYNPTIIKEIKIEKE